MTLFPPKLNENKFIYGKICEKIIINLMKRFTTCSELDTLCASGSSYKYDIKIFHRNYSIKCMKQKSSIILINKNYSNRHTLDDMSFMIMNISKGRLYIFTYSKQYSMYVKDTPSCIRFKSSLFTHLDKTPHNYFDFSKDQIALQKINNLLPIDIHNHIYKTFIS